METQLVRLDPPYNIIYDAKKGFALHISTLIIIDEVSEGKGKKVETKLRSRSFPVVSRMFELEGESWTDYELKFHHKICRQGETVSLRELRLFMEYCYKHADFKHMEAYPMLFDVALLSYGVKMNIKDPMTGLDISDYEVELIFDDQQGDVEKYINDSPAYIDDGICDVHSGLGSPFFFDDIIYPKDSTTAISNSIIKLTSLRDAYLYALKFDGIKSITFTTKNPKYQSFVERLNNTEVDSYAL